MLGRRWMHDEGAAMVEFAIVVPILLLIVWGMVDFSRAFFTSNSLATAVREGARYASSRQDFSAANLDSVKKKVRGAFTPMGGDTILSSQIIIVVPTPTDGSVKVTVDKYQWKATTPLAVFSSGKIEMTRSATFRWERDGN
jgi:Flp pilus assembly protein TadG